MVAIHQDLRSAISGIHCRSVSRSGMLAHAMKFVQNAAQYNPLQPKARKFERGVALASMKLLDRSRRVAISARIVSHGAPAAGMATLSTYIHYLKRKAVTENVAAEHMFDSCTDWTDDEAFVERCSGDRYHIRFIISPEDGGEMTSLAAFARDLLAVMECDFGSRFDWIAINHYECDIPHVHVLVRGRAENSRNLVINRDYIERRMRRRAEAIVATELGPKREAALRAALDLEVEAECWTGLDAVIRQYVEAGGMIDLLPGRSDAYDSQALRLMIDRLRHLERMGLAIGVGQYQWVMAIDDVRSKLRRLGIRRKIGNAIRRAMMAHGIACAGRGYAIHDQSPPPIIGRLVAKGLHDELTEEACAMVDGVDRCVHYVRFLDTEALKYAPVGGIVEVHRLGLERSSGFRLALSVLSDLPTEVQVTAAGVAWLDRQIVAGLTR